MSGNEGQKLGPGDNLSLEPTNSSSSVVSFIGDHEGVGFYSLIRAQVHYFLKFFQDSNFLPSSSY